MTLFTDAKEYIESLAIDGITLGSSGDGLFEVRLPPHTQNIDNIISVLKNEYKAYSVDMNMERCNNSYQIVLKVWFDEPDKRRETLLENPRTIFSISQWNLWLKSSRLTLFLIIMCFVFLLMRWWQPIIDSVQIISTNKPNEFYI